MTLDKMSPSLSAVSLKTRGKNGRIRDKKLENFWVGFEVVFKVNQGQSNLIKVETVEANGGFRVWAMRLENAVRGRKRNDNGCCSGVPPGRVLGGDVSRGTVCLDRWGTRGARPSGRRCILRSRFKGFEDRIDRIFRIAGFRRRLFRAQNQAGAFPRMTRGSRSASSCPFC
jgi:hypothetical protein